MDQVGQIETIQIAWHVDIGKQHADVISGLKNLHRLLHIGGLDHVEARLFQAVTSEHPDPGLVIDKENEHLF
jgi:hypothetical protein